DRVVRDGLAAFLGFLTVAFLGIIGYGFAFGEWDILSPTFRMVFWGLSGQGEQYRREVTALLTHKLYVYVVVLVLAAYFIAAYRGFVCERVWIALGAYASAAVSFLALWQFALHGLIIELFYYFSLLIPALIPLAVTVMVSFAQMGTPLQNGLVLMTGAIL